MQALRIVEIVNLFENRRKHDAEQQRHMTQIHGFPPGHKPTTMNPSPAESLIFHHSEMLERRSTTDFVHDRPYRPMVQHQRFTDGTSSSCQPWTTTSTLSMASSMILRPYFRPRPLLIRTAAASSVAYDVHQRQSDSADTEEQLWNQFFHLIFLRHHEDDIAPCGHRCSSCLRNLRYLR